MKTFIFITGAQQHGIVSPSERKSPIHDIYSTNGQPTTMPLYSPTGLWHGWRNFVTIEYHTVLCSEHNENVWKVLLFSGSSICMPFKSERSMKHADLQYFGQMFSYLPFLIVYEIACSQGGGNTISLLRHRFDNSSVNFWKNKLITH